MSVIKKASTAAMAMLMLASVIPMTSLAAHYEEWVKKDGKWYYYDYGGHKVKYSTAADTATGKTYVLDGKGARVTKKGLHTFTQKMSMSFRGATIKVSQKQKVYVNKDVTLAEGLKKVSDKYYFFSPVARICDSVIVGETTYYFGTDGVCYKKESVAT